MTSRKDLLAALAETRTALSGFQDRLADSLAESIGPMLAEYADQELYALALTTDSDVITVRLMAHTEQELSLVDDLDEEPVYYRWWPDEWSLCDDAITPGHVLSEALYDLERAAAEAGLDHREWVRAARGALHGALGSERVRAAVAAVNPDWHPVLFVTDTDGDMDPTVESLNELNLGHPRPDLVAQARTFFEEN